MNLKEFNSENCSGQNRRQSSPCIRIDTKVGCNRINGEACELVGLKEGDQVKFHQDNDDPENWYLEKVKDGGFVLRAQANSRALIFNNTPLARKIADSVAFTERGGKCLIAGKATEFQKRKLFGVITSTLRNN